MEPLQVNDPTLSPLVVSPQAALVDGDGDGLADAGETVDYTFTLRNTGGSDLSDPAVRGKGAAQVRCPAARGKLRSLWTFTSDVSARLHDDSLTIQQRPDCRFCNRGALRFIL